MSDLAPSLYVALGHLVRALRQEAPSGGLGAGGVSALATLARSGPMRASALAESEGLSAAATSRVLNRLELDGLATRSADPQDGRAQLVTVTEAGRRLITEGSEVKIAALRRRLAWLTDDERAALAGVVSLLERLAEGGRGSGADRAADPR